MTIRALAIDVDATGRARSEGRRLLNVALSSATSESIAKKCGVTAQAIRALSSGAHAIPSLALALALADALGIDPHAWMTNATRVARSNANFTSEETHPMPTAAPGTNPTVTTPGAAPGSVDRRNDNGSSPEKGDPRPREPERAQPAAPAPLSPAKNSEPGSPSPERSTAYAGDSK